MGLTELDFFWFASPAERTAVRIRCPVLIDVQE